jgi:hypothetical protein
MFNTNRLSARRRNDVHKAGKTFFHGTTHGEEHSYPESGGHPQKTPNLSHRPFIESRYGEGLSLHHFDLCAICFIINCRDDDIWYANSST